MLENLLVAVALFAHDGGTDLAEADAMTPAVAVEDEATGDAVPYISCLDGKGAALQGRGTEHTAYLQFLADDEGLLLAHDAQLADVPAGTFLHDFQGEDWSEVHLQMARNALVNLFLRQLFRPFVEVARLKVVVVEDLTKYLGVVSIAEGVLDGAQVGHFDVLPTVLILVCLTTATLAEACVANLSFVHQDLPSRGIDGFRHLRIAGAGDALIALAVVVGADVEDGVVLTVVPADALALTLDEGEEGCRSVGFFLPSLHLGMEPTAADDGSGFEELQRTTALHLAADDARQVVLDGQDVDGHNLVLIDHELEDAAEGLR